MFLVGWFSGHSCKVHSVVQRRRCAPHHVIVPDASVITLVRHLPAINRGHADRHQIVHSLWATTQTTQKTVQVYIAMGAVASAADCETLWHQIASVVRSRRSWTCARTQTAWHQIVSLPVPFVCPTPSGRTWRGRYGDGVLRSWRARAAPLGLPVRKGRRWHLLLEMFERSATSYVHLAWHNSWYPLVECIQNCLWCPQHAPKSFVFLIFNLCIEVCTSSALCIIHSLCIYQGMFVGISHLPHTK